jgi:hypothetical protein
MFVAAIDRWPGAFAGFHWESDDEAFCNRGRGGRQLAWCRRDGVRRQLQHDLHRQRHLPELLNLLLVIQAARRRVGAASRLIR